MRTVNLRVATWNLERCPSSRLALAEAQRRRIDVVGADIWIFTETFLDRSPGDDYSPVFSPPHALRRSGPDERFVGIWSRWPIRELDHPLAHRRGSAVAQVDTPGGPVIVYGSVIPYAGERHFDDGQPARPWEVHLEEIRRQGSEWLSLRHDHPGTPMIVAGDFNQARSGRPRSYGTAGGRAALSAALNAAGLRSLTDVDLVTAGQITGRSHVEHICVNAQLMTSSGAFALDRVDDAGRHLSDHPTIVVDLMHIDGERT